MFSTLLAHIFAKQVAPILPKLNLPLLNLLLKYGKNLAFHYARVSHIQFHSGALSGISIFFSSKMSWYLGKLFHLNNFLIFSIFFTYFSSPPHSYFRYSKKDWYFLISSFSNQLFYDSSVFFFWYISNYFLMYNETCPFVLLYLLLLIYLSI